MIQYYPLPRALRSEAAYLGHAFQAVWVAGRNLEVLWANAASGEKLGLPETAVSGRNLSGLISAVDGKDLRRVLFPAPKMSARSFAAYLNLETETPGNAISADYIAGTRVDVTGILRKGFWILFLKPIDSPLVREYASTSRDFILSVGPDQRILRVVPNFFFSQWLKKNPLFRRPVTSLLKREDWETYKKNRDSAAEYVAEYGRRAAGRWTLLQREPFHDLSRWAGDPEPGYWKTEPGKGFRYTGESEVGYLYLRENAGIMGRDFTVTAGFTAGTGGRAALVFNQEHPTQWDPSGYNVGIGPRDGRPFLTFKKNTRFLFYHPLAHAPAGPTLVRAEKCGGHFRFLVNGTLVKEFDDLSPLSHRNGIFGLMAWGNTLFTRFEIRVRESRFDERRTLASPRLSILPLPGRTFEVSGIPVEDWSSGGGPQVTEALRFTDVTEIATVEKDRDALHERVAFLKQKDYFGFVGGNPKILDLLEKVEAFAESSASVLIGGPTGSGKEVLARAIHLRSNRREKPFVKVDCASLPHTLLESELFGHEKGAFTGAVARAAGRFEAADQGTLFLDEIGNIDLSLQAKLLGFLEDREFTPLGGGRPVKVDVRIVAATNAPLDSMIRKGLFREDLYYRLKVIHVNLPPLKERRDDIPLLVERFLETINQGNRMTVDGVSPAVMEEFLKHDWPGNVRELYNVLLNLAVQKKTGVIEQRPEFGLAERGPGAPRVFIPEGDRHAAILKASLEKPYFSARDCLPLLPVSLPTLKRDLRALVASGKLARLGKGPAARYRKTPD